MNALARHIADAIAETAEEHLPRLDQTAYFHVKKALETVAAHVATVLEHENEDHASDDHKNYEVEECEWETVKVDEFLAACCIGGYK